MRETTALGAAIAAGFAVDVYKEYDELKNVNQENRMIFEPQIPAAEANKMYHRWNRAVQMCKGWTADDPAADQEEPGDAGFGGKSGTLIPLSPANVEGC